MDFYALLLISVCAAAIAAYAIYEQNKRMMQSLKDWLEEEKMLTKRKIEIVKDSLKTKIACLNMSKKSMESLLPLKIGRFEDLQNCVAHIKETEDLLAELNEVKL